MALKSAILAFGIFVLCTARVVSADFAAVPAPQEEKGIWAAIAYSSVDEKHGLFWGADTRRQAADIALEHCASAGGDGCSVVALFRNHRHRDDDDHTGFPYKHCGALAVGEKTPGRLTSWGAESAHTRRQAEDLALQVCERAGDKCWVREWVCT